MVSDFSGFPSRPEATPIPATFFSEVLPGITDLAELKVTLVALRRVRRRKGAVRWVTALELCAAPELGELGLAGPDQSERKAAIEQALTGAVERGVLVRVPLQDKNGVSDTAYFINEPEGRRAAELVRAGAASVGTPVASEAPVAGSTEIASIYHLYEQTIGPVPGAGLAEELTEAEREYPAEWLRDAFLEAAVQNVRRWAYIRAILARWRDEGRSENGTIERRSTQDRYRAGKYGRVVRWK